MKLKSYWHMYKLKKALKNKSLLPVVILTGAGISAESGLATFRGQGGLWNGTPIAEVCRPEALAENSQKVLSFYNHRRLDLIQDSVIPNVAHEALASLESILDEVYIITQNVDNLHEEAGSRKIFHIHGQLLKNRCGNCKDITYSEQEIPFPNYCIKCQSNNSLRPDVVFFKEQPYFMPECASLITNAKVFIAIGTSGLVYPAAGFVKQAKQNGAICIEVNPNVSETSKLFDFTFREKATKILPYLVKLIT